MLPSKEDLKALPQYAPLIAAVIAPISTLLDIPALSEPWFFRNDENGKTLPDPRANIALSAAGLSFNVLANALLIIRFSSRDGIWRFATRASLICWFIKFGIGFGNVLGYGLLFRNDPGVSYNEGFWCAVISLIISAVIVAMLLMHYLLLFLKRKGQPVTDTQREVRVAGRHFMLQTTCFVATIGILALYMSRLEQWTYSQGIFFSVVTFLTIGFGDFFPTKAATQIVLFPFALIGIVQIAALVDLLVRFFRSRVASRHANRRNKYERRRQDEQDKLEKEPDLEHELRFLRELYRQTNHWKTMEDLAMNSTGFVSFWIIGALIFSQIEGWTYGQGLYFCYIFFFTIGYGDFTPISPAGRIVFIIFSLLAVPVMSSFAVQTIENLFKRVSFKLFNRQQAHEGVGDGAAQEEVMGHLDNKQRAEQAENQADEEMQMPEDLRMRLARNHPHNYRKSHTDFVAEEHKRLEDSLAHLGRNTEDEDIDAENAAEEREQEREQEEDRVLTEYVLELAVELEKLARRLLLGHMSEESDARMLLKADRIVQLRNIRSLAMQEEDGYDQPEEDPNQSSSRTNVADDETRVGNEPEKRDQDGGVSNLERQKGKAEREGRPRINALMRKYYEEEAELVPFQTDISEQEALELVGRYREAFAGLLAAGSRLLRLKDKEECLFERRYWKGKEGREASEKAKGL